MHGFFICSFEDDSFLSLIVAQMMGWKFEQMEVESFR